MTLQWHYSDTTVTLQWHFRAVREWPGQHSQFLRDFWETFERCLRDFWETFEKLLRGFWVAFERLLRDFWETDSMKSRRKRVISLLHSAKTSYHFIFVHWHWTGWTSGRKYSPAASSSEWKWTTLHLVWIEWSRREELSFDSSSDQTRVTATNPIQENLSMPFFSQEFNWCDPGLRGWPALHTNCFYQDSGIKSVEHEPSKYEYQKNCSCKW